MKRKIRERMTNGRPDIVLDSPMCEDIQSIKPLIMSIALRFSGLPIPREDLVQAGYVGLLEARKRYNPSSGIKLSTYAFSWILGEMRKTVSGFIGKQTAVQKRKALRYHAERLCQELKRSPTLFELAQACGLSISDVAYLLCIRDESPSIDRPVFVNGHHSLIESLTGLSETNPDALDLHMALEKLDEQARHLILLRYYRGYTQSETAEIMGKSQSQISKTEQKTLNRLHELLS